LLPWNVEIEGLPTNEPKRASGNTSEWGVVSKLADSDSLSFDNLAFD
jgi:hypothetical protein